MFMKQLFIATLLIISTNALSMSNNGKNTYKKVILITNPLSSSDIMKLVNNPRNYPDIPRVTGFVNQAGESITPKDVSSSSPETKAIFDRFTQQGIQDLKEQLAALRQQNMRNFQNKK